MVSPNRRGYAAERQLVQKLRKKGYNAVRVPVSAPSSEPLPDVFATKDDAIYAFEVKSRRGNYAYFYSEQVDKLFQFLKMFKPFRERVAVLAAKFGRRWIFRKVEKPGKYVLKKTDESNLSF